MQITRELKYTLPLLRGEDVRAVQLALMALQIDPPCGTADGVFGPGTKETVMAFQRARPPLQADGIVGQETWNKLFEQASATDASSAHVQAAAAALVVDKPPPLNDEDVARAKDWLMRNFGGPITQATASSRFDVDLICAIACQETASKWLRWIDRNSPADVLAHCVFDPSGDYPGTSRGAFPRNAAEFRARYGDDLTNDLIAEANASRALDGFHAEQWLYKGYGIFQYDLQNIQTDEALFREKQWRGMEACIDRLVRELNSNLAAAGGDLRDAVRRYNGAGVAAEEYAMHVMQMRQWSQQHTVVV